MHGTNPKRPPLKQHDGKMLDVVNIFTTIQGEGPLSGTPAIFIRLGGCNLACDFCDAEFEDYQSIAVDRLVTDIASQSAGEYGRINLVVITGGEPLRQNITPFCDALISHGYQVQIESNGTLYQELPAEVTMVCSPKNTGAGYMPLRPDILARANALKFIISASHAAYLDIPDWAKQASKSAQQPALPPIYIQPMDEYDAAKNQANQQRAMQLALKYRAHLSLQLQKVLQIA